MTFIDRLRPLAVLIAISLLYMGGLAASAPAAAMQILEAADHAELAAEISAREVSRIALARDRIARVVRSPDGFAVEHDAASGDLYLRPADAANPVTAHAPVTLFIGTERGFTYRLTLTPAERGSAQILIRNPGAMPGAAQGVDGAGPALAGDPRIAALVRLVRAVARREPLPGYAIHAGAIHAGTMPAGLRLIETWRGPRYRALVLEAGRLRAAGTPDAAGLAGTIGALAGAGRVAALWLAAPGTGPSGGRLAVAVTESAATGEPR